MNFFYLVILATSLSLLAHSEEFGFAVIDQEGSSGKLTIVSGTKPADRHRLKRISEMVELKGHSKNEHHIIFVSGSLLSGNKTKIEITSEKFGPVDKEITYLSTNRKIITHINGKMIFGTDGSLPTRQYQNISVTSKNTTNYFPGDALEQLYEPNMTLRSTKAYRDPDSGEIYITAFNSDGAGSYYVVFQIRDGKFIDRLVHSN